MTPRPLFFGQKPKAHIRYSALRGTSHYLPTFISTQIRSCHYIAPHNHITLSYSNHYMTERVSFSRLAQTE